MNLRAKEYPSVKVTLLTNFAFLSVLYTGDEAFAGCHTRREFGFGGFRGWTTRLSFLY